MSAHKEQEEDDKEVPISSLEGLTDSSLIAVSPLSLSEAEELSAKLHHMWDSHEPKDNTLVTEVNRKFDEICGNFPENVEAFDDEAVLELLHELYHWLANIKASSLVHEDEQSKHPGVETTKKS